MALILPSYRHGALSQRDVVVMRDARLFQA